MKKLLLSLVLLSLTCIVNATFNNKDNKTADKNNSNLFKMSRNSNRLSLFESISSTLKIKKANQNAAGAVYSSKEEVLQLLGTPDLKINNAIIYTLNPLNGCKAIIEFDTNNTLVFFAVKDCK